MYPLKQGLKPFNINSVSGKLNKVKVVYPLKQGLKQMFTGTLAHNKPQVKVVYPLKQGLKLTDVLELTKFFTSLK